MRRFRIAFTLLFFFTQQTVLSQGVACKISGSFTYTNDYKFAYLLDSDSKVIKVPVKDGKFQFEIDRKKDFVLMNLYFGVDSLRKYSDVLDRRLEGVSDAKVIAIEKIVDITIDEKINEALVTGGMLNKDLSDMKLTKPSEYEKFFKEHPDSPVSLMFLKVLSRMRNGMFSPYIDCKLYFSKLSEKLRNSPEGKELFSKL